MFNRLTALLSPSLSSIMSGFNRTLRDLDSLVARSRALNDLDHEVISCLYDRIDARTDDMYKAHRIANNLRQLIGAE